MAGKLIAQVSQVTQDSFLDMLGKVQYVVRVRFNVGDHGPFVVEMPRDTFSADAMKKEIQKTVDQINALLP